MAKPSPQKDFLSYQKGGPGLARACLRLGSHRIGEALFAEAMLFATKARELGVETPENELNIAACLMVMGKPGEAEGICRNALKTEPENRGGHILLGQALMALGKPTDAAKSFQSGLNLGTRDGEVLIDLGLALEAAGDEAGGADYFERAKSDHPELFEELLNRADLFYKRFLNQAARETLKRAEKVALRDANAYLEMGLAYFIMGFAEDAEKHYKTSIRLRPTLEGYRNLAELYEKSNDLTKAETFARASLQLSPDEPSLNLVMAHAEGRQGLAREALARYQKVLKGAEDGAIRIDALNQTGHLLDKAGKTDEAYENFAVAKELIKKNDNFETVDIKAQHKGIAQMRDLDWTGKIPVPPPLDPDFAPGQLVFLIGFPRSGTTLLQEILGRHKNV
ncbi:MAG: tetratricopeptide repeat protein, partial [Sphingomonadales bacterium]